MKPKVIAIVGPTASGKTQMAIDLAKQIDGEIVSADSRLVYKGFDIASAKPTIELSDVLILWLSDAIKKSLFCVALFFSSMLFNLNILSKISPTIFPGL